ncbi:MAG TPA: hypothetical protein VG186_15775 [Solirubrobacteraceae bacterium]|jgi:hypothetical protein|nr:hypothetical protein [Solirubrobacteraceae bacterium]
MGRKSARLAIALSILAASATAAWAAAKGPIAGGYYASTHPRLAVVALKPATKVTLYIGCFSSPSVAEYWDSAKLPLKNGSFSFDGKTTISTENGGTFGTVKGTVLFTGKFSGGKFKGTAQIVGSSCPKSSYTAKYDKNGGGSGK